MDKFRNYILSISPLSEKSADEFISLFSVRNFSAKEIIVESGKIPSHVYFLDYGIVRSFHLFPEGKEYTRRIYSTSVFFASYSALVQQAKSSFTFEAISDCKVLYCNYIELDKLSNRNLEVGILVRKFLEAIYVSYAERNYNFLTQDATERYLNLRNEIPNVDNLVPQKQIASNVGITSIQLSRIKKKIANQS